MTWPTAVVRGLVVFLYFVIATVWVPHRVLSLGFVADASSVVSDLVLLIIWGGALVGGMYLLRLGQRRGMI